MDDTKERPREGHIEKVAICKPRQENSGKTKAADTLLVEFWSPETWENKFLLLKKKRSLGMSPQTSISKKETYVEEKCHCALPVKIIGVG